MNKNTYKDGLRDDDYPIDCDDCGQTCWYSDSRVLDKDTSKGGLRVCPNCVYATDWGAVPFTIEPEKQVPDSRQYQNQNIEPAVQIDFSTFDPMSGNRAE